MKRRDFLQRLGWTMAALGISEAGLSLLGRRYYQALAQPTSRKLALLVGINQYPTAALTGGVTDVELQRSLLIHRFGFNTDDIITLTDKQATREQIETAFIEHLIEQAGPDDVVVFHFSGYGRQVRQGEAWQNTLVPVDGGDPSPSNPQVNDLSIERLHLLLHLLPTQKAIAILDASYLKVMGPQLVGSVWLRARSGAVAGVLSDRALALPEKLSENRSNYIAKIQNISQLPGMVLAAANPIGTAQETGGKAFEAQWNGFSTGLFTYAITQQLWLATAATTIQVSFSQASGVVEQLTSNEERPKLSGEKSAYLTQNSLMGADGAVRAVEVDGQTVQLWLGGLPPQVLENYGVNSLLQVALSETQLQITSRSGLTAKAKLKTGSTAVGQLVREAIRVIPRQVSLTVGLSPGLERIERVDATSAFSGVANVKTVTIEESPQSVDCLFGKVDKGESKSGVPKSYSLLWPAKIPIGNTVGSEGEAVKTAVQRLTPQLKALQGAKLLRLTQNAGSSRLGVKAALGMVSESKRLIIQDSTVRGQTSDLLEISDAAELGTLKVPVGSRIRYWLENKQSKAVYFLLFGLDSNGNNISISVPARVTVTPVESSLRDSPGGGIAREIWEKQVIGPGETIVVPGAFTSVEWAVKGPPGLVETQLIFSIAPFTKTLEAAAKSSGGIDRSEGILTNPLEVAKALLEDLHQASTTSVVSDLGISTTDSFALDVNAWATLSFIYQVV